MFSLLSEYLISFCCGKAKFQFIVSIPRWFHIYLVSVAESENLLKKGVTQERPDP
jgi:hypothetical protein